MVDIIRGVDMMLAQKLKQGDEIRVIAPSRSLAAVWVEKYEKALAYGKENIRGVVFGRFDDSCKMSADVIRKIIAEKLPKEIPVLFGVDFGHVFPMITLLYT